MSVWIVIAGAAVFLLVLSGAVAAAVLAVAREVDQERLPDD